MPEKSNNKQDINKTIENNEEDKKEIFQLILEIMSERYKQHLDRIKYLDNKSASMIAFIGGLLTIQATLGSTMIYNFLKEVIPVYRVIVVISFILALIYYAQALSCFIRAYHTNKFSVAPDEDRLLEHGKAEKNINFIRIDTFVAFAQSIEENQDNINHKVVNIEEGFAQVKVAIKITILTLGLALLPFILGGY